MQSNSSDIVSNGFLITPIREVDFFTDPLNPIISSLCDTLLFNIIIHPPGESNLWYNRHCKTYGLESFTMNNNHRITLNTNKNIIVEFTNERIIPASGLAVVGALLGKKRFH